MAGVARATRGVVAPTAELGQRKISFQAGVGLLIDPFVLLAPVRDEDGEIIDFLYGYANDAAIEANLGGGEDLAGLSMLQRSIPLLPVGLF